MWRAIFTLLPVLLYWLWLVINIRATFPINDKKQKKNSTKIPLTSKWHQTRCNRCEAGVHLQRVHCAGKHVTGPNRANICNRFIPRESMKPLQNAGTYAVRELRGKIWNRCKTRVHMQPPTTAQRGKHETHAKRGKVLTSYWLRS